MQRPITALARGIRASFFQQRLRLFGLQVLISYHRWMLVAHSSCHDSSAEAEADWLLMRNGMAGLVAMLASYYPIKTHQLLLWCLI